MSRVWTAAEVERLVEGEISEIVLLPGDLISPSGRDVAESRGLMVRRADQAATTSVSSNDGDSCACGGRFDHACTCGNGASTMAVDDKLVARIRELAGTIAVARPDASAAEVARETLSALGANGSPGIGTPEAAQPLPGHRFPTKAKGARPSYHDDAGLDAVISTVTTLASEVWVLRERVMTLESLLAEKRAIELGAVDAHHATGADAEARMVAARAFVSRVLRVFFEWREEIVSDETQDGYHEVIRRAYSRVKGSR